MGNLPERRSYGQFCGLARALDVVGDRWTLLIVRELLAGPSRFRELQLGLPGIATNLLTERLRQLEGDGLVVRALGGPTEGTRYALTPRGEELRAVVEAILRWSSPLMVSGPREDVFRAHWLRVALPALVRGRPSRRARIGIATGGEDLLLESGPEGTKVTVGRDEETDGELMAEPGTVLGLAAGALDIRAAIRMGAKVRGDRASVERVFSSPSRGR